MEEHLDLGIRPMEAGLLVADIPHGEPRHMGDELVRHRARAAILAGDDEAVRGGEGLAGHAHLPGIEALPGGFAEEQVHDLVRDPVADLVRMTLGNRLTREKIARSAHGSRPS